MLAQIKERVCLANLELPAHGLVTYTWGNVSMVDRDNQLIVIKPSGLCYETMRPEDMVVVNFDGDVIEGQYRPSSDTPTHIELYRRYPQLGGIVHTHSTYATAWAQAGKNIPALGTTHADYFLGEIPCTRALTANEIDADYERQTGLVIIETFKQQEPLHTPGVIVFQHGPFTWGVTAEEAVHHAVVLEEVAKMAWLTYSINQQARHIDDYLMKKHFMRKHGPAAYYGQS